MSDPTANGFVADPRTVPRSTDQEIGALKHRVGLLEEQMRELVEMFKRRKRGG